MMAAAVMPMTLQSHSTGDIGSSRVADDPPGDSADRAGDQNAGQGAAGTIDESLLRVGADRHQRNGERAQENWP